MILEFLLQLLLCASKKFAQEKDKIIVSDNELGQIGLALAHVHNAYERIQSDIPKMALKKLKVDDATKGFVERNIRKALLAVARASAPFDGVSPLLSNYLTEHAEISKILSDSVSETVARRTIIAFLNIFLLQKALLISPLLLDLILGLY